MTFNRSSASPSVRVGVEKRHYTVRVRAYRALPSVEIITTSKLIPLKLNTFNSGRRQSHDIAVSVCVETVYNFISVTLGCWISFLYIYTYISIVNTLDGGRMAGRIGLDWIGLHWGGTGCAGRCRLGGFARRRREKFSPYILLCVYINYQAYMSLMSWRWC